MAESTPTVAELIALAERVLAAAEDSPAASELAARYAGAFDAFERSGAMKTESREALERLEERHQAVLALVESLAGQAADDLRKLRRKGKGIRAYLGRGPKSPGAIKSKKG